MRNHEKSIWNRFRIFDWPRDPTINKRVLTSNNQHHALVNLSGLHLPSESSKPSQPAARREVMVQRYFLGKSNHLLLCHQTSDLTNCSQWPCCSILQLFSVQLDLWLVMPSDSGLKGSWMAARARSAPRQQKACWKFQGPHDGSRIWQALGTGSPFRVSRHAIKQQPGLLNEHIWRFQELGRKHSGWVCNDQCGKNRYSPALDQLQYSVLTVYSINLLLNYIIYTPKCIEMQQNASFREFRWNPLRSNQFRRACRVPSFIIFIRASLCTGMVSDDSLEHLNNLSFFHIRILVMVTRDHSKSRLPSSPPDAGEPQVDLRHWLWSWPIPADTAFASRSRLVQGILTPSQTHLLHQ